MRKIGTNTVRQKKDAMKVVYIAIDQRAWEAVEKVDLCHDCQAKDWGEDRCCCV